MRKIISLILCLISLPAAAQIIPPRYAGSDDPDVFRKQFEKKVTKVMKRDGYRIEELSHELLMKFTIDTLGRCVDVQYPDSLGGVRFNPTQRSRELLNTALSELNPFTPAYKDGRKIPYEADARAIPNHRQTSRPSASYLSAQDLSTVNVPWDRMH